MFEKILVTGGAGFIGSNFVLETLERYQSVRVIVLDKLTYAGNLENLKGAEHFNRYSFVKGDICDKALVTGILKEYQVDCIAHFAAESHVDRSIEDPSIFLQTNVMGTFNLMECAKKCWGKNAADSEKLFLHVSTDEVYGSLGSEGFFNEESPYRPNSPYSASKASSDLLVRSYFHTYGFPVRITNCSNNYGPFQFPEKLIPLIINNIIQKNPLPVYGEGRNIRDWLYVADHCRAILRVMEKGVTGGQYNIGGHNEWKNIDIVNKICEITDKKLGRSSAEDSRNLIVYVKDRPGHDLRYAIDAGKMQRELGWVPEETFETGLEKTIDWYLNNRAWLDNVTSGNYQDYYRKMYRGR